jgi:hypothetical protein
VQSIRSLPESDDPVLGVLPSKTIIARDNLLIHERDASGDRVDDDDDDIWRPARVLGPNVFKNAAPFLRVCDVHSGLQGSDIFSVKDNMRVHPQDEAALVELACIAVDIKSTDTEEREGAVMRAAIYPEKVCIHYASPLDSWHVIDLWRPSARRQPCCSAATLPQEMPLERSDTNHLYSLTVIIGAVLVR